MKNFNKNLFRNIKKDKSRFISIFLIIMLGSSIFAGLQSTPIIMKKSMTTYLNDNNYWDLSIVGTYGFLADDLDVVSEIANVEQVSYKNRFDVLYESASKSLGLTGYGYYDFDNTSFDLLQGNFPQQANQAVIDRNFQESQGLNLGNLVEFANDQGVREFEIVGIVDSAQYIAAPYRGVNSLGDGNNYGFFGILNSGNETWMLPQELYDLVGDDIFNEVDIQIANQNIFSSGYDSQLEQVINDVEVALENLYHEKYDELQDDAYGQIAANQAELDDATAQYEAGVAAYDDGVTQYNDGYDALQQAKEDYETGYAQYEAGLNEYQDGYEQYQSASNDYDEGYSQYEAGLASYQDGYAQYEDALSQYQTAQGEFDLAYADIDNVDETTAAALEAQKTELESTKAQLDATALELAATKAQLDETAAQLAEAKAVLDETAEQLSASLATLEETRIQLVDAKAQIDSNEATLEQTRITLDNTGAQLAQTKIELDEAQAKIDQATADIEKLDEGRIYTFGKDQNDGVASFEQNAGAIQSISYLFPIIFFLVAALVSMTTMTRMVEEQRVQNGTLLSLGFSKKNILNSYLLFVIIATLPASIIGIGAGINFFPRFIYYLYSLMLYDVGASAIVVYDLAIIAITLSISVGIIMVVTYFVAVSELREEPANLLRPKPPKMGKRILLDRITPIWKRLSFNSKVTLRNIFRYKRRFIMSIIGIAGCSALVVLAFGLRYSITQTVVRQFEEINLYDYKISYGEATNGELLAVSSQLAEDDNLVINNYFEAIVQVDDNYINLQVEHDDNYQSLLNLNKGGQKVILGDSGVAINNKLSETLGVSVGDTIELNYDDLLYPVTITNIFEYYYGNVMFMSDTAFESAVGDNPTINRALVSGTSSDLTENDLIISQETNEEGQMEFGDQLESIDTVVIILIFAAGFLNLIVIYNLTNINIQERLVEISTIKVLGFYPREIYDYIFRENIYLGIIGSFVGMGLGTIAHYYLIITVEMDTVQFVRTVDNKTYLFAFAITMVFTVFVNLIMRRIVNNINMVESLKSIE